jgi:ribosomal protein S18 acetylase RimI-like enzyme
MATEQIRPARPEEWPQAFRLVFQYTPKEDRQARVRNALRLMRQGELNPAGVIVLAVNQTLLGAMVCLPVAGATALVWPPQAVTGGARWEIEDRLMTYAIAWLRGEGAKLGQTLLAPEESQLADSLKRHDFVHITNLCYMRHDLRSLPGRSLGIPPLTYQTYKDCDRALFHQVLCRSYEQTRDCPEVNGVRTLQETIAGHQAQGIYDPVHWWLAQQAGHPVGALLIAAVPEQGWDLSYVGVVPESRRRGIGKALTQKALEEARAAGADQLTLAVDTRNLPAWNLYRNLGFEPFDQREVYLAIWNNHPANNIGECDV